MRTSSSVVRFPDLHKSQYPKLRGDVRTFLGADLHPHMCHKIHIFSVDEYYWEDRLAYYAALDHVRGDGEDLTGWLEYCAEGLRLTLERVWTRIQTIAPDGTRRLVLRPRQERLLSLLGAQGSMSPSEIWEALGVSRPGAMDLINPLLEAGLIEKVGTKKTGRYRLTKP